MDSWQLFMERVELVDGVLVWKDSELLDRKKKYCVGKPCRLQMLKTKKKRYWMLAIRFKGKRYRQLAHRLIYALHTGEDISGLHIDHINGDGLDNRIENLRALEGRLNQRHCKLSSNNSSGRTGVAKCPRGGWLAQIMVDRKHIHLGRFEDFGDAVAARESAEQKYGFTFVTQ